MPNAKFPGPTQISNAFYSALTEDHIVRNRLLKILWLLDIAYNYHVAH